MMPVISVHSKARRPIWVTSSVPASEGKKTEKKMIMSTFESLSNSVIVVVPLQSHTSRQIANYTIENGHKN
jgi:hypothetical protein